MLVPDGEPYFPMSYQPQGELVADSAGIRHRDADLAASKTIAFIRRIHEEGADLAVTPEYSTPWGYD